MKLIIVTILFLIIESKINAQIPRVNTKNTNSWFVYNGTHKVTKKIGIHAEVQWRRANIIADPQQLLLRTGINYHINNQTYFTLGYCFVQTEPYGAFPVKLSFPENRLWQQVQCRNQVGKLELINRIRLEQRFSKLPTYNIALSKYEVGDAIYTNRARFFLRTSVPFKGKTIGENSLYLTAFNELFVNFGKNVQTNLLDQNRLYLALGFKLPKLGRLELGFLEQTLVKPDGIKIENNHTMQIALNSTLDFFKSNK
jgi:hypothetical protein